MMSGEVMTFPVVDRLSELQVLVAERVKIPVEFLQLVQGNEVLCEPVEVKSLAAADVSCVVNRCVPRIIKVFREEGFHFRGLNETATKTPQGFTGCNLLHASVLLGKLDVVHVLLGEEDFHGINSSLGRNGYNALHLAAKDGHSIICQELLSCERFRAANASATCEGTALHIAAQHGHVQARMQWVWEVEGGYKFHFSDFQSISKVMSVLLDSENFTAVNEALQVPSYHAEWSNKCGQTALHVAAVNGQQQAAQVLLDHPRFTQVGAVTKTFKDAAAAADAAGKASLARWIRDHPKVRQFRRMPKGSGAGYGGFMRRAVG
eukprot:Skav206223  [mRNA]  locus=scaffold1844:606614:607791:- [translate_table: standard]